MSRAFRPIGDRIRMQLDPVEVELLQEIQRGLEATLEAGDAEDPVIARLFPATVHGDDEADAELRSLLRDELLEQRRSGLRALVDVLDRGEMHRGRVRIDLVDDEPHLVLGVLNDLRLAIGARVGIDTIDRTALPEDDTLVHRLAVMDHLAWLQEQLLACVDPEAVAVHDGPDPT